MNPADLELWRAFYLRPGEDTFRPVYEETKSLVQTLCLRLLRDEAETRDAFQSTYCRLLLLARHREKAAEVEDFRRLIGRRSWLLVCFLLARSIWLSTTTTTAHQKDKYQDKKEFF